MNDEDETDFDEADTTIEMVNTYGGEGEFERHQECLESLGKAPKVDEKKGTVVYKDVKYDGDYAKFDPKNILYYACENEKSWIFKINIDDNTSMRHEISNLSQKQIPSGHQIIQMPLTNKIYVSGGIG